MRSHVNLYPDRPFVCMHDMQALVGMMPCPCLLAIITFKAVCMYVCLQAIDVHRLA